jgi:hypothetical protein
MKDAREAEKWSKMAANQGNGRGFNTLGNFFLLKLIFSLVSMEAFQINSGF